ncbi:hypothetical protein [Halorhodospira halophila]|uniref:hypothetical protein n=1 Tax=Halorhodospira halophila TaxID=1053 RepID=UPI001913C2DB|nr:hypothetical protein [Halorhodospira halophila]MBK5943307.1 hypothetical protein [Halorhodospira halophila]
MPAGRPQKEFHQYLTEPTNAHVGHDVYIESPATAFLYYAVQAKKTVDLCARNLPTYSSGRYTKASLNAMQNLVASMLPALMGHFETFQRHLFAGLFDRSVHLRDFSSEQFFRKLNGNREVTVNVVRLAAHRNTGVGSVGMLVADSLGGWHDPRKVNDHFQAFFKRFNLFGNHDIERLRVLWQLRHSIVHTGGTLTLADAQKVTSLERFGETRIAFENNFIFETARKLHPIVKRSTERLHAKAKGQLLPNRTEQDLQDIEKFFEVRSPVTVWF